MSRKLTLDINFIDTPRDGDVFGYQISNNGNLLNFNGFNGWDKTFKDSVDYTTANGNLMAFNTDLTPNVTDNAAIGNGFNGPVNVVKKQSDGKYICVGGFGSYQDQVLSSRRICRLNTDFTLDTSFTPPDFYVDLTTLEIDSTDRIYLGNEMTIGGKKGVQRLNANGTQDTAYPVGIGFDRPVMSIKLQPDNKLIVAGVMTLWNGSTPCKGIIRLTDTGIKDSSFNGVNQGFVLNNSYPRTIDLLSTGEIVVGGDFYFYNNTSCGNIIILTTTGAVSKVPTDLDNAPTGALYQNVLKVLVDPIDKIYVTGKFEQYGGGVPCHKIIRLYKNSFNNWVPDLTFNVINQGLDNGNSIYTTGGFDMLLNDSGNLVVAGNFGTVQGTVAQNIAVLHPTGGLSPDGEDTTGVFGLSVGAPTLKTILNLGDRFIIGGSFYSYSNSGVAPVSSQFIIPIAEAFTPDFGQGFDNGTLADNAAITLSIRNNKFIVGGDFNTYDGTGFGKVVRINADGSTDYGFDSTVGVQSGPGSLVSSAIDKNNKVYIGGDITSYNGTSTTAVARINDDGSFDATFDTGAGVNNAITCILPDDINGGALFLGAFYEYSGITVGYIAKPLDDGTLDPTFNIGTGFNAPTLSALDTGDGYIIGGVFTQFSGVSQVGLVKLKYDGSRDTSFNSNASAGVNGLVQQSDGKIICMMPDAGYTYNGISITGALFRINQNGSYDPSFNSSTYSPGSGGARTNLIEVDSQDRIYVYSVNDLNIIRFTKDGVLDTTFNVTELVGSNSSTQYVWSMKMYFNNLVVVGTFEIGGFPVSICMLDETGTIVTTDVDNYQNIINTYDNLLAYNSGYGIYYNLLSDKVRMIYEFDDDNIIVNDVYDTPDYVEITFTNESLTINEIIEEVVVRSPLLIKSAPLNYDSVNYQVRIFDGNLFSGLTYPVLYEVTKQKLFAGQANVYININNYVREKLEGNVLSFVDNNYSTPNPIPLSMSKWVRVDETLLLTGTTVDTNVTWLYATDGFLYNYEQQGIPNILHTGNKRYMRYDQLQQVYFQTNFLTGITVTYNTGSVFNIPVGAPNLQLLNDEYVNSLSIASIDLASREGPRPPVYIPLKWADYTFSYSNSATQTIRYEFYDDCQYEPYSLVFKNKWGMLESIPMSRKSVIALNTESKDYNRSILDYNGDYDINRHTNKQYNVNGYDSWTLNSNWLPEYMNQPLEELMLSEEVWLIDSNSDIIPVTKEDQSLTFKTELNDRMIQYTIKVKMSHSKIKNIL